MNNNKRDRCELDGCSQILLIRENPFDPSNPCYPCSKKIREVKFPTSI